MRVRNYELMFVISPLFADDESVANVIERVSHAIEHEGGAIQSINHTPPWGRRRLAYPIRAYASGEAGRRNFTEGFYVLMHFSLEAGKVSVIDRTLRFIDPILRHLLTITTDEMPTASASNGDLPDAVLLAPDEGDEDDDLVLNVDNEDDEDEEGDDVDDDDDDVEDDDDDDVEDDDDNERVDNG